METQTHVRRIATSTEKSEHPDDVRLLMVERILSQGLRRRRSHLEHVFGEILPGEAVHVLEEFVLLTGLFADSDEQGKLEKFLGQTGRYVSVPAIRKSVNFPRRKLENFVLKGSGKYSSKD